MGHNTNEIYNPISFDDDFVIIGSYNSFTSLLNANAYNMWANHKPPTSYSTGTNTGWYCGVKLNQSSQRALGDKIGGMTFTKVAPYTSNVSISSFNRYRKDAGPQIQCTQLYTDYSMITCLLNSYDADLNLPFFSLARYWAGGLDVSSFYLCVAVQASNGTTYFKAMSTDTGGSTYPTINNNVSNKVWYANPTSLDLNGTYKVTCFLTNVLNPNNYNLKVWNSVGQDSSANTNPYPFTYTIPIYGAMNLSRTFTRPAPSYSYYSFSSFSASHSNTASSRVTIRFTTSGSSTGVTYEHNCAVVNMSNGTTYMASNISFTPSYGSNTIYFTRTQLNNIPILTSGTRLAISYSVVAFWSGGSTTVFNNNITTQV